MRRACVVVALAFVVACQTPRPGDDGGPIGSDTPDDDVGREDAGMGAFVRIRGVTLSGSRSAVPGITVSDALHPEMAPVTSDEDAVFVLFVPRAEAALLVLSGEGRLDTLVPLPPQLANLEMAAIPVYTRADLDWARMPLGPSRPGTGTLLIGTARMRGRGSAAVELSAFAADTLAITYVASAPVPGPDPALVATSGVGAAIVQTDPLGAPGVIALRASALAGHPCIAVPSFQHPSRSDVLMAPVRPDAVTLTGFDCTPPAGERMVWGRVSELVPAVPFGLGPPIIGAEVCVAGGVGPCSPTIAAGLYALDLPALGDHALTYDAAGRQPVLVALATGDGDVSRDIALPGAGDLEAAATAFGVTHDPAAGAIEFFTTAPGVSVAMAVGTALGPHYLGPTGVADPGLSATSTRGAGLFFSATPASFVELAFERAGASLPCSALADTAWSGPSAGTIRVPVAAGYLTFAAIDCGAP